MCGSLLASLEALCVGGVGSLALCSSLLKHALVCGALRCCVSADDADDYHEGSQAPCSLLHEVCGLAHTHDGVSGGEVAGQTATLGLLYEYNANHQQ